jgi:hypothetical protein
VVTSIIRFNESKKFIKLNSQPNYFFLMNRKIITQLLNNNFTVLLYNKIDQGI